MMSARVLPCAHRFAPTQWARIAAAVRVDMCWLPTDVTATFWKAEREQATCQPPGIGYIIEPFP